VTGKVLHLEDVIQPERLATRIAEKWVEWDMMRARKRSQWEEVLRYVTATDTTMTSNSDLPWKNKTTIPKTCQIYDNLVANYLATLFPQRKWLIWEAAERNSNSARKRKAIVNYMQWAIAQASFKREMSKCIHDYVIYGNPIGTVEWVDERVQLPDKTQAGYVGPAMRRISPLDIVFNPIAESFQSTPKIIRSLVSMGEVKKMLMRMSTDENREEYQTLWDYLVDVRQRCTTYEGDVQHKDAIYEIEGFSSYRDYLDSDQMEILTFYGDMFDPESQEFLENHVIIVVDRHKLIGKKPNPSFFGYPPIFHSAWRMRQDNLWGMGPLDNLIGMQYRVDHVENMKADVMDLGTYPVQKIKGFVEDYTWQPGEKIFVGEEGDVTLEVPDVQLTQTNMELGQLLQLMEEMAGAPKEAMGFRTPGEKTKYEVQRLENAASRIFQNKIKQFEEQFVEPLLNAMLEMARRNLTGIASISVFDDEFKVADFKDLTVQDITGIGRIKPVAARHFAEQAEAVQNLSNFAQSPFLQLCAPHISGVQLTKFFETMFNLEDFEIFTPYIALSEQADAQRHAQAMEEQVAMEQQTATGMGEDFDVMPQPEEMMNMNPEETPA
jgi:hypothetical protein